MLLIVGEVYIDYTLATESTDCKVRLGGIIHAARGLWASNISYAVALIGPSYIFEEATSYLIAHGCSNVYLIGEVFGSPNVISFTDPKEVTNQGYEDLLRDQKKVTLIQKNLSYIKSHKDIVIFPGSYDLSELRQHFSDTASISIDIAYNISDLEELKPFQGNLCALITSTSSELFLDHYQYDLTALLDNISNLGPEVFILKENRGGSRWFLLPSLVEERIPAELGETKNSVGVGDVYSAISVARRYTGWSDSIWRASRAATFYSQTTFPDDFKRDVQRDNATPLTKLKSLGGTSLTWHERPRYNIYFAAPDFSYIDRKELEYAISCLKYHNFSLRRPIIENGELTQDSSEIERVQAYHKDLELISACEIMFAIPLKRDPGTLIEVGIAQAQEKPVIVYDPFSENDNNMLVSGCTFYSNDLDLCLNMVFSTLSDIERKSS